MAAPSSRNAQAKVIKRNQCIAYPEKDIMLETLDTMMKHVGNTINKDESISVDQDRLFGFV